MSTLTEEYINEIISQVATYWKLKKWRHHVQKFKNIGQNYFGVIIPVTLSGSNYKGNYTDHSIVLKLAPTDERYRVSGAVTIMFQREIFVYSILMKKYEEMQLEIKLLPGFVSPTLYFVRDEYCKEVIAMQNMLEAGYEPYTHKPFLDLGHITIALESLAQLHVLSFIFKEKDMKLYNEVTKVCIPQKENTNKRFMDILRDRLAKAMNKFEDAQYVPLLEKLKLNCGQLFDIAIDQAKGTCICHGDVWKENILFKYDKNKKPMSACLIDYQTTRVSSPAFDALYLIISSTDTHLRKENYFNLLNIYYKTLSMNLKRYLEPQKLYSREMFDHDLKLVAPACLITANTALWLSNGLQEEGHVRSKKTFTTLEEKDAAVDEYKTIVKAIIDDFYSYGYFPGDII